MGPNGFNMDTSRIEVIDKERRTIPEATPPGEEGAEQRGNERETVTLCYSHSKEKRQGIRTGPEPGKAESPPTTRRRGRKARTMSHSYALKGKVEQEDRRRPGAT